MKKGFLLYVLVGLFAMTLIGSCKKSQEEEEQQYVYEGASSTLISAFSLEADTSVLAHLDSVFFSIDHEKREIYNADSLPKGTNVSKILINLTLTNGAKADFTVKGGERMKDSTWTYNLGDTIDFTGEVSAKITSYNGAANRTYSIKVNVHKMNPDSLYWSSMSRRDLPNAPAVIDEQKTVSGPNKQVYCLLKSGSDYVLSVTDDPENETWNKITPNFTFVPQVSSLVGTAEKGLFILDVNGNLYNSETGADWTSCGVVWHTILGGFTNKALGVMKDGSVYKYDEYPCADGYVPEEVEKDFPIEGASEMALFGAKWYLYDQGMIVGGRDANGDLHGDVWGYDGKVWGLLAKNQLPPREKMILFQHYLYEVFDTHRELKHEAWFAIGGRDEYGIAYKDVYITYNHGLLWRFGDQNVQLPTYIHSLYGAQSVSITRIVNADGGRVVSKAATDVTEWAVPYIYLVGGENSVGKVYNNIWCGALNRVTFKPII